VANLYYTAVRNTCLIVFFCKSYKATRQAVSDKLLDAYKVKVGLTIVKIFSKAFKRLHERI
jgi:hypothetical protein